MKHRRGPHLFRDLRTPLVHVVGDHVKADIEGGRSDSRDHVWISLDPGLSVRVTVSVNTFSIRNGDAGFDPRVRLGILRGSWTSLPERGISECGRFRYEEIPGFGSVEFVPTERSLLERGILERVQRTRLLEVWGTPYHREAPGIHNIHSRRGSCAMPESLDGRDGALRFYFGGGEGSGESGWTETLLLKFCGQ